MRVLYWWRRKIESKQLISSPHNEKKYVKRNHIIIRYRTKKRSIVPTACNMNIEHRSRSQHYTWPRLAKITKPREGKKTHAHQCHITIDGTYVTSPKPRSNWVCGLIYVGVVCALRCTVIFAARVCLLMSLLYIQNVTCYFKKKVIGQRRK